MKRALCIVSIVGLMAAAGCQESQEGRAARTPITAESFKTIAGMQWNLRQMTIDGEAFELADEKPFIQFDADKNKVTGSGSVNRFFGSVKIDEKGRVQWPGPFGSTQMAGPPEQMKQEAVFLKTLPKTDRLSRDGIHLYAAAEDGKTELVFYVPVE